MIQRASSVGELASKFISRGGHGTVTRVFRRSAYVKTGTDFLLLLWNEARSPMTINIQGKRDGATELTAGEDCELNSWGIKAAKFEVAVAGAWVYHGSLRRRLPIEFPGLSSLVKGVAIMKSLYDVSPHGPLLPSDPAFRRFTEDCLRSCAHGTWKLRFDQMLSLVGRGGGFTPAGDDFTAGFTAAFNFVARSRGMRPVTIPKRLAYVMTVPESAAIMTYSSRGYVDEGMERLILSSLGGREFFYDLMGVASRGHTSGIDMSLGVLLAEAAILGATDRGKALKACLEVLWQPRQ